jgi:hypothetical protein
MGRKNKGLKNDHSRVSVNFKHKARKHDHTKLSMDIKNKALKNELTDLSSWISRIRVTPEYFCAHSNTISPTVFGN